MSLIQIVIGSTRAGRFADKPARWVQERLAAREDMEIEVVDLRDHPLPLFDQPLPPAYSLRDYPSEDIARLGRTIDRADGFVFLTPEYNHGPSGALKNALDHTFPEWHRKPVAFVGWGNIGGGRAIEQLRAIVIELEMAPLRHAVHILPDVMRPVMAADYDAELFASLDAKLDTLADDLSWWAATLAAGRAARV
jgi:NAD(P)H-dependent FMN reductase